MALLSAGSLQPLGAASITRTAEDGGHAGTGNYYLVGIWEGFARETTPALSSEACVLGGSPEEGEVS